MEKQNIPFEATPQALHFRLSALEDKVDALPDDIVNKLKLALPSREECEKRHAAEVPWGKILAGVVVTVTTIIGAYFGVPVSGQQPPQVTISGGK